jgi:hypothetical protein
MRSAGKLLGAPPITKGKSDARLRHSPTEGSIGGAINMNVPLEAWETQPGRKHSSPEESRGLKAGAPTPAMLAQRERMKFDPDQCR